MNYFNQTLGHLRLFSSLEPFLSLQSIAHVSEQDSLFLVTFSALTGCMLGSSQTGDMQIGQNILTV